MLGWIKLINGIMSLVQFFGGMVRDERLKQDGENRVGAANAKRLKKARDKAHDKVKSFDDAIAAVNRKLHGNSGDNR
jgi:hypothetical protein